MRDRTPVRTRRLSKRSLSRTLAFLEILGLAVYGPTTNGDDLMDYNLDDIVRRWDKLRAEDKT